ncbi:Uncharacterized protein M6B38_217775 [Iris pallida]|uniref:Retrotransposon gag domain-containing protein n=1 Tax=Iris pallida TaxID=29817 RepID=A0AAX6E0J5_IRIPA|nr:Uncharacterized protein M6B38_217775 [Iris pallida]
MGQMLTFLQQILETQRAQAEAQQRQTDAMRQGMEDAHQLAFAAVEQRAPHPGTRTRYGDIQDFKKLGPRDFSGTEGVVYADDWLEDIERQMRASRLADDLKVEAVGLQLLDIARTWFRNEPALAGEGRTWAEFKLLFKEKFFSSTDKIDLVRQFQDLQQGSLSVEEYAAEFGRLSRYAEYMVRDPKIRASRFREGLTWDIKIHIPSFYETYTQIYAEARKVEREWGLKPKRERDLFSGATSSAGLLSTLSFSIVLSSITSRRCRPEHRFSSRCSTLSRGRHSMGLLTATARSPVTSGRSAGRGWACASIAGRLDIS